MGSSLSSPIASTAYRSSSRRGCCRASLKRNASASVVSSGALGPVGAECPRLQRGGMTAAYVGAARTRRDPLAQRRLSRCTVHGVRSDSSGLGLYIDRQTRPRAATGSQRWTSLRSWTRRGRPIFRSSHAHRATPELSSGCTFRKPAAIRQRQLRHRHSAFASLRQQLLQARSQPGQRPPRQSRCAVERAGTDPSNRHRVMLGETSIVAADCGARWATEGWPRILRLCSTSWLTVWPGDSGAARAAAIALALRPHLREQSSLRRR